MLISMVCKKICIQFSVNKTISGSRYAAGQKRCQTCEIFIQWDGIWCPCCGYMLRTHPRNSKSRKKSDLSKNRH